jgi:glycosyltransferase involved in cell wall biosynthesis
MTRLNISIAMCTYNGEKFLWEQLDSIARQTRLPDELIICDDNSADRTLQIIDAFAASASFPVKLFRNKVNIGSTKNFEQVIRLCEGSIIVLADQDDVWHPDKLKVLEQLFLNSEETGAVFSNARVVSESLVPMGYTLWDTRGFKSKQKKRFKTGNALEVLLKHNVVTGATLTFRSTLRDLILPIPGEWVHDAWIAILIAIYSKADFIDNCLIDYRQHNDQQIGSLRKDFNGMKELAKSIDNYYAQIRHNELLIEHILQLKIACDDHVVNKITDKISHLKVRNSIYRSNMITRLVKAAVELLTGRYHNYSNGYLSACKDLFLIDRSS